MKVDTVIRDMRTINVKINTTMNIKKKKDTWEDAGFVIIRNTRLLNERSTALASVLEGHIGAER